MSISDNSQPQLNTSSPPSVSTMDHIVFNIVNITPTLSSMNGIIETTTKADLLINEIKNYTDMSQPSDGYDWTDILIIVIKVIILSTIIIAAIFGNLLVIISVCRHHKLRITTNYFIVSLACADILVAVFAMTFNASVAIAGKWVFNDVICDFWNSCDVLFSTASIMHLSCISYDRYYAIIKPLDYPMKITTKRVGIMITFVWIASALISYIPIFTGLYTTEEYLRKRNLHPDECIWEVNIPYAIISSTVSFWLPCGFMLTAYYKIYVEAIKQERFIYKSQQMVTNTNHHNHQQRNSSDATNSIQVVIKSRIFSFFNIYLNFVWEMRSKLFFIMRFIACDYQNQEFDWDLSSYQFKNILVFYKFFYLKIYFSYSCFSRLMFIGF
jgi:hypothetical protein